MGDGHGDLKDRIAILKKSQNAVIFAHNYGIDEVQDVADFVGDSLELVQRTAETEADVVVLCAVHCIVETAAVACPHKTILMPVPNAACPMANMITAEELRAEKEQHPGAAVVCYLNSSAEVKAESDICCTAENAGAVVNSLGDGREIMFVPDQYLGEYVARQTGRNLILWPGYCPTHSKIMPEDIARLKADHPAAKVVVHPECSPATRALADAVLNTGDIVRFARETDAHEVIVGTDTGILHRLRKENPGKVFFPASELARCGKMKLTTLENILWSLEDTTNRIEVRGETLAKAKRAVDRMLEVVGYAQGQRWPGA